MKKLLALVLALVMTLSLATVSSNAAFKDAKDINENYAEAAAVLNGLGVFKGYAENDDTFSFKPQGDITRAEVAAIVYRIYTQDVKDTYAKNYETYNKFSDMAGAGWAKGYIGYCANAAFIKGYPDGTFKPLGKVTGYEALAMILRAVGYDQKNEFTGADWQLHVAQIAEQNKILQNVKGVDLNKAATRELVAELLFQAIQIPMVTYTAAFGYQNVSLSSEKGQLLKDNVSLGSKNFGLDCYEGYVIANAYDKKYSSMIVDGKNAAGEKEKIKVADQDIFDAGRYGHVWTSDGSAITDVFYDDTLLSTTYDGTAYSKLTTKSADEFVAAEADGVKFFNNGREADNAGTVVVGTELKLYTHNAKGTVDSVVTLNQKVFTLSADPAVKNNSVKIFGTTNFNLTTATASGYEDLAKDDVALYAEMADGVTYFEKAKSVDGQKTYYYNGAKGEYMTFGGEKYVASELVGSTDDAQLFGTAKSTFEVDAVIWLDRGGNVIATEIPDADGTYAMVIDAYRTVSENHRSTEYYVNLLGTDGEETGYVQVKGPKAADEQFYKRFFELALDRDDEYNGLGTLVTYKVDSDGLYVLSFFENSNVKDTDRELSEAYKQGGAYMEIDNDEYAITKSSVVFYYYTVTVEAGNGDREVEKTYYGVNVGKGTIPAYSYGADMPYMVAGSEVLSVAVVNDDAAHAPTDYAYIYSFDGTGTDKNRETIYYYSGVLSDGTVKEFITPFDEEYVVGKVVAFYVNEEGMADFTYIPFALNASVKEVADGDTAKVELEGEAGYKYYVNVADVYDLTSTKGLKDGDKVENFTLQNRDVRAVIVPNAKWDGTLVGAANLQYLVQTVFVIDEDVVYGDFAVDRVTYHYPVTTYWPTIDSIDHSLEELNDSKYVADEYHITKTNKDPRLDVTTLIENDEEYTFVDGGTYQTTECEAVEILEVKVNNKLAAQVADKDEFTIELDPHETVATVTVNGEDALADYEADGKVTATSMDGFCTKDYTLTVTNAECEGKDLAWTNNKTFEISWVGSTLTVAIDDNQTLTVADLSDVLYVAHSDGSKCTLGDFVIYDSVVAAGHEAASTLKLVDAMNDLRIVVTAENGDTWTVTVAIEV